MLYSLQLKRVEATDSDEFADWEKSNLTRKGNQQLSDTERLRLSHLEKENSQLRKELAQFKATTGKQGTKSTGSTSATAAGNTACFTCGKEGHRADRCPTKSGTPATPRTAGAKSAAVRQESQLQQVAAQHSWPAQEHIPGK
jgi:hypothetical protein